MTHIQWEHNVVNIPANPSEHLGMLDVYGLDGWQLVTVADHAESSAIKLAYFRRPLPTPEGLNTTYFQTAETGRFCSDPRCPHCLSIKRKSK